MARIILALCLLISSVVSAQPGYTNINSRYKWIAGGFDSSLILPRYNGVPSGLRSAWNTDGQLAVDTANNRLYVYSGGAWVRVANYSDVGSTYTFPYSVVAPGNAIQLENDTTANPANYFYGRNSAGRRGWYAQSDIIGVNIYNSDGTIPDNRTVEIDTGKYLFFNARGANGGISLDHFTDTTESQIYTDDFSTGIYRRYNGTNVIGDAGVFMNRQPNTEDLPRLELYGDGGIFIDTLNATTDTTGKSLVIRNLTTGLLENIDPALIGGGGTPISSLTAATGSNSIDNEDNFQSWDFTNFSTIGLGLFGETTQATGNGTRLFVASTYGANANSSQTTFAADFINSHTGTSSTNVGARFMATSGTNNYAAQFSRGRVSFGTVAQESGYLELNGSSTGTIGITTAAAAGTYTLTLPTTDGSSGEFLQTDGSGVLSWAAGGGISAIGTINSETKSANGAVISGTDLVMQTVDDTYPGLMTSALLAKYDSLYNGDVQDSVSYVTRVGTGYDTVRVLVYAFPDYVSVDSATICLIPNTLSGGITALTGDVTASGTGSVSATIANNAVTTAKINNSAVTKAKIENVAVGKVLGNNTTSAAAPVETGVWMSLTTGTASAAATIDIDLTNYYTVYDEIKISFYDLRPATDNVSLYMRVSSDGSTYNAGASDYKYQILYGVGAAAGGIQSTAAAQILLGNNLDNTSTNMNSLDLLIKKPGQSTLKPLYTMSFSYLDNTPVYVPVQIAGLRDAAQVTRAVRFLASSGNISGSYSVTGIKY